MEDWRRDLDNKLYVGVILMDLSKAFDYLPHDLILDKLVAYSLSEYLSNRKQRVKLGNDYSDWSEIIKGVPKGAVFDVFINVIFYFVKKSSIYNYADESTWYYSNKVLQTTKIVLENESTEFIEWFFI